MPGVPVWLEGEPVPAPAVPAAPAEPAPVPCMSGVIKTAISTFCFSAELGPVPLLPAALQWSATLVALATWKFLPEAVPACDPAAVISLALEPAEGVADTESPLPCPVTCTCAPTRVRRLSKLPVN